MYFLLVVRAFLAFVICQALSNVTFAQAPDDIQVSRALPWQFKGTFRGISVGYEFRIGKAKRRRCLWKRKNCQSRASWRNPPGPPPKRPPPAILAPPDPPPDNSTPTGC